MTKPKSDTTHASEGTSEKFAFGTGPVDVLQLQRAVAEATQEILSRTAQYGMRRMAALGEYATALCACKSPGDIAQANAAYWQRYFADIAEQTQEAVKTANESVGSGFKLAAE